MSGQLVVKEGGSGTLVQEVNEILKCFIANRQAKVLIVDLSREGEEPSFEWKIGVKKQLFSGELEDFVAPENGFKNFAFYSRLMIKLELNFPKKGIYQHSQVELEAESLKEKVYVVHHPQSNNHYTLMIFKGN